MTIYHQRFFSSSFSANAVSVYVILFILWPIIGSAQPQRYPPVQFDKKFSFSDFGYYFPMYVANRIPFIDVYIDGIKNTPDSVWRAKFLVDYGTDTTVLDLKGFPGTKVKISKDHRYSLTFKDGPWEKAVRSGPYTPPFCYEQDLSGYVANGICEGGIIGTDILSQVILTLDYKHSRFYIVTDKSSQCTAEKLTSLGFTAATTSGCFSNDESTLDWHTRSNNHQKNNNPHVKIFIGDENDSAQALGSIDPGYDDKIYFEQDLNTYYTHVVNINKNFYDHLRAKKIGIAIDRNSYALLPNRTKTPDTLYKCNFSKKYMFSIISTQGKSIYPYSTDSISVVLKLNGTGGASAGGITTLKVPAVQFGGSFLLDFDMVTFDPYKSLIWFKKPE